MSQVALNFRCSEQKFKLFCNSFGNFFNGHATALFSDQRNFPLNNSMTLTCDDMLSKRILDMAFKIAA